MNKGKIAAAIGLVLVVLAVLSVAAKSRRAMESAGEPQGGATTTVSADADGKKTGSVDGIVDAMLRDSAATEASAQQGGEIDDVSEFNSAVNTYGAVAN